MHRRGTVAALTLIGACVMGGCGSSATPSPGPDVPAPTTSLTNPGPGGTPDALVGMWRVTGAAGEPAGSVLRLAAGDGFGLMLFRKCGFLDGDWAASTGGAFIATTNGGSMSCVSGADGARQGEGDTPPWLTRVRAYRVDGPQRELLAADGTQVARLLPGGQVRNVEDLIQSLQQPPTLDPATVSKLRAVPQPLPAGATPATATTILGKWVPYPTRTYANGKTPYLEFDKDGTWTGSDGCNGSGGAWALVSGGELVSTSGPSTLIGCDGAPTGAWLAQARRAAISARILTLYAADGMLVARLTR